MSEHAQNTTSRHNHCRPTVLGSPAPAEGPERDPVCGMMVPANASLRSPFEGQTYLFCNPRCLRRFEADPGSFLPGIAPPSAAPLAMALEPEVPPATATKTEWTCPMHPEIVRSEPGSCPICGMALQSKVATLDDVKNPELRRMTRRFRAGVALSVPRAISRLLRMLDSKLRPARAACPHSGAAAREHARVDQTGHREVEVFVSCRYEPAHIRVRSSERVRLTFIRTIWNGCAPELLIPALDLRCELRRHQPVIIDLPRLSPGEYQFSCGTRAIVGTITVTSGA